MQNQSDTYTNLANLETTIQQNATEIIQYFTEKKLRLAIAESCTGGKISATLTDIPGASAVFDHAVLCYANPAKTHWLGVSETQMMQHGAVSEYTARCMAETLFEKHRLTEIDKTPIALAVTGIAGPDGGSAEKPVGLVWIAVKQANFCHTRSIILPKQGYTGIDLRHWMRANFVHTALKCLKETV